MSVEALRMLERIIVACGGVASIYLGYRLFVVANLTSVSGGTFKSKIFSMTLTKVGPGVFFALFGAYVLASNLSSQISYSTSAAKLSDPAADERLKTTLRDLVIAASKLPDSPEKDAFLKAAIGSGAIGLIPAPDPTSDFHGIF
jgi:hypothetical protein